MHDPGLTNDENSLLPSQTATELVSPNERRIFVAVLYQALADLEGGYEAINDPNPTDKQKHLGRILPKTVAWFMHDDGLSSWVLHEPTQLRHTLWLPDERNKLRPTTTRETWVWRTNEPIYYPFSFDSVCAMLNLDKKSIRTAIKQWIAMNDIGLPVRIGLYHHNRRGRRRKHPKHAEILEI